MLWFGILFVSNFNAHSVTVWLVGLLSGTPDAAVFVLGWLPFGLICLLFLPVAASDRDQPTVSPWLRLAAPVGLLAAFEVPIAFHRRHGSHSDTYEAAAATQTYQALEAGAMAAFGPPMLWVLVFLGVRWLLGQVRGQKVKFRDGAEDMGPWAKRVFGFGAAFASLLGLGLVLLI